MDDALVQVKWLCQSLQLAHVQVSLLRALQTTPHALSEVL